MDIGKMLRAKDDTSVPDKFTIYLPDRDENNRPVKNMGRWIDGAFDLMLEINGGCTRLSPAKGGWIKEDEESKTLIIEDTAIIYSFLLNPEIFEEKFYLIVEYLHAFGIETKQDSVMAEFCGYDEEQKTFIAESYTIPKSNYLPKLPNENEAGVSPI